MLIVYAYDIPMTHYIDANTFLDIHIGTGYCTVT